ncbi:MarR family transcriptional regulator, partial [Pseudoxanthobacter sp.]|uniref:MarR family winged helix-turn-helix transcriptional regulator n=1 Tax=Pseudoxanthobacter sp. TaxID=1925742 RepID=UPI002FE1C849
ANRSDRESGPAAVVVAEGAAAMSKLSETAVAGIAGDGPGGHAAGGALPGAGVPKGDREIFGQLISRVARYWRRAIDQAMAESGLSQATALPLLVLSRLGPELRQGVIADELGLEGPSLVRVVEMLVSEGLVERREDPQDRRARLLRLTPAGVARVAEVEAAVAGLRARFLDDLGADELHAVVTGLTRIEAVLVRAQQP